MNYDHRYHAGNHADILKHVVLLAVLQSLSKKPSPWCFLDTHAGFGEYHIPSQQEGRAEQQSGIGRIIQAASNDMASMPDGMMTYVSKLLALNPKPPQSSLNYYGSTLWALEVARAHDRVIACEQDPKISRALKRACEKWQTSHAIHQMDGYLALRAFLPPKERRACVLMDPPFEADSEWVRILEQLKAAFAHWPLGHYLLWYPIKDKAFVQGFWRRLPKTMQEKSILVELYTNELTADHLGGSGIWLLNPPWQIEETLKPCLAWIWKALSNNNLGGFSLRAL